MNLFGGTFMLSPLGRRFNSLSVLCFAWIVCCQPFAIVAAPSIQDQQEQSSGPLQQCRDLLECEIPGNTASNDSTNTRAHNYIDWFHFWLRIGVAALLIFLIWSSRRGILVLMRDLREDSLRHEKESRVISDQIVSELLAVELRRIFSIHDLAYEYIRHHFRNQEISNSQTCADMTRLRSQIDPKNILIEDTLGYPNPFHEDLGQISTQAGPINAIIPLQSILHLLMLRPKTMIQGSVQKKGTQEVVIAQLFKGKHSWSWRLPSDHDNQGGEPNRADHRIQITNLAYHIANRIMGQSSNLISSLPGKDFKRYTQLLENMIAFLQADSGEEAYANLKTAHEDFSKKQPTDIRTYYMNYFMALIAIKHYESKAKNEHVSDNGDLDKAYKYLSDAISAEPVILSSLLNVLNSLFGAPRLMLHWKPEVFKQLSAQVGIETSFFSRFVFSNDQLRARRLANQLGNVNAAFGYVLEKNPKKEQIDISFDADFEKSTIDSTRINLENAIGSYQRAFSYDRFDPLHLANEAEVELKLSDHLQPADSFLVQRLKHRTHVGRLLDEACREKMRNQRNYKYALLRNGNYNYYLADFHRADKYLKQSLKLDPSFSVAARNLATVYSAQNQFIKALDACDLSLDYASTKTEHTLFSKTMHGWIHNSRGWAYFQLARKQRSSLPLPDQIHYQDWDSWLNAAKSDFSESFSILKDQNVQTIPVINLFLLSLESFFGTTHMQEMKSPLNNKKLRYDVKCLRAYFNELPPDNTFTCLYRSVFINPELFSRLFKSCWNNHVFMPSEYYGVIGDLWLMHSYLSEYIANDRSLSQQQKDYFHQLWLIFARSTNLKLEEIRYNLRTALKKLTSFVPPCYFGIHFLWSNQVNIALPSWGLRWAKIDQQYGKLQPILFNSASIKKDGFSFAILNHALWRYVYFALISIFSSTDHYRFFATARKIAERQSECKRVFSLLDGYLQAYSVGDDLRLKARLGAYRQELLDEVVGILTILVERGPQCVNPWRKEQLQQVRSFLLKDVLPLKSR